MTKRTLQSFMLIFLISLSISYADDVNIPILNDYLKTAEKLILEGNTQKAYAYLKKIPINGPDEIAKQRQKLIMQILETEKQGKQDNNYTRPVYQEIGHKEFIKNTPENAMLVGFIALSLMVGLPWLLLSCAVGVWASMWNHSFVLYFIISIIISPVVGAIIVLIIGKRKICPYCAEKIKIAATICPYCRNNIQNTESIKPMKKL